MNTRFSYMYRDGDNYKNAGAIVLAGEFTPRQEKRLKKALSEGEYFIASQVGVPEVFLWDPEADYDPDKPETYPEGLGAGGYVITESDHSWHEFIELELTEAAPTDPPRTIEEFVQAFEKAKKEGWKEFEPASRRTKKVGGHA